MYRLDNFTKMNLRIEERKYYRRGNIRTMDFYKHYNFAIIIAKDIIKLYNII